jgi:hypothetical protein
VGSGPAASPPAHTAESPAGRDADVIIDLTGTAPPPPAGTPRSLTGPQRRIGIALGAVALVAVALAIVNFAVGMQWRSVALAAQDRAALAAADAAAKQQAVRVAREARDVAELRREAMAKQLAVSEADVAALEARVAALASDKARAEDYGTVTRASSSGRLRALKAQLDSCITQIAALRTSLRLDDPASTALDEEASAAQASCEQAGADAAVMAAGE